MSTVFFRDKIIPKAEVQIALNNRAFRYGDGCFETIRIMNGIPVFWSHHMARLRETLDFIAIELSISQSQLCQITRSILLDNEVDAGILRIQVFREGEGKYFPESNEGCVLIECNQDDHKQYPISVIKKEAFVFNRISLPMHVLGIHKVLNKSIYIAAAVEAKRKSYDEAIILNTNGNVVECISSNIFMLKGNQLMTPPLTEGCLAGVIRSILIENLINDDIEIRQIPITMSDVWQADEIWTTNAATGISVINKIGEIQFGAVIADEFQKRLIEFAINSYSDFQESLT